MEIPKMKVFIYILTFLGYAWSGYGSGIINNLKDAVLAAEHVFKDVLDNVVIVARKFKDFHDVFDAAVEEDCKFTCPNGGAFSFFKIIISSEHLPMGEMTKCCDEHDICYDTCNQAKEHCDYEFKNCLYKICDKYEKTVGETAVKTCKAAAKMLFTGTITLGCKSYLDSQKQACYCTPNRKKFSYPGGEL
uniref:Group XIIA secretory phospholipase A2 n=1 Tax=Timema poppense TaxID=170557 RepID=A0A7R9DGL2_TIMPO|nr:unnamed protein product [Timema poppensis]